MSPLVVRGAAEHNLAGVDLELETGRWIVITGPSGSGKSSLVFGTIAAESQRRYLSTLSARARHVLGQAARPRVAAVDGLPVAIAVGEHASRGHARSTVGTLTGIADLMRLWFARAAKDPDPTAEALTRSHFSFNHPRGACPQCEGLGVVDRVDPDRLVAHPDRSIRDGALATTLPNGYTVYSQVTLEVMDRICRAHGFDVDTRWAALDDAQREVVLYGTDALEVPFGKHTLESRMRWKGITAKPRKTGFYRGLVPVIEEILGRDRNPGVLRFVRSVACPSCGGTRLARPGREARLHGATLPELSAVSIHDLDERLAQMPDDPVGKALRPSIYLRLQRMRRTSLGHLSLERASTSLSGGEAQRVRLIAQLTAGLSGMLVCFDEPTLGLHPEAGAGLAEVLDELVEAGNTLMVVEHDPEMVRHGEHLIEVGPGAGPQGGRVIYDGPLPEDPLGPPPRPKTASARRLGGDAVRLRGASLHNLRDAALTIRGQTLHLVIGPSGAGKSSLVFGTLLPALRGDADAPTCSLEGAAPGSVRTLDARPPGKNVRSTPATSSGLFDLLRERFAATASAKSAGLRATHFSFNTKAGRCPSCEGLGVTRLGLHLVADAELPCPDCGGRRYTDEVLAVTLRGVNIGQLLAASVREVHALFEDDAEVAALTGAMVDLGLGYLALGQSSKSLSRGEGQRLRLASLLALGGSTPTLLLLDEPDRGLSPSDVTRLVRGLDRLVDAGHTVLAISHHRHLWAAADTTTELRDGVAREIEAGPFDRLSKRRVPRLPVSAGRALSLRGVTHHNLRDLDVTLPHDQLVVVVGVSGSGKSSLVFDTIAGEAWRRYGESLPFAARRFMRQLPAARVDHVEGLRPAIALAQGQSRASRRSTVATQSELGPALRTLWSRAGRLDGAPSGLLAEHFSPDRPVGRCPNCDGLGIVRRCDPRRLVTHPDRSLADGAFAGTRPGKFFTEPHGRHLATLAAALPGIDLSQPWCELPPTARQVALRGTGDRNYEVQWQFARGKRRGEHAFESTWPGFCALVEQEARRRASHQRADAWTVPLREEVCPDCHGDRLGRDVRRVEIDGLSLPALFRLSVTQARLRLASVTASDAVAAATLEALRPQLLEGLTELEQLGLGHLALDRSSHTLSVGERQRVRLAGVLRSQLNSTVVVLDEPATGLHTTQIPQLVERLQMLRDRGNTVIAVSHRPELIRAADHLLELGPGAAAAGGRVVAQGAVAELLAGESPTAIALRRVRRPSSPRPSPPSQDVLRVKNAHAHNLRGFDLQLPATGLIAVTGVSGSGKSSLVFDVIGASADAKGPQGCDAIHGLERFVRAVARRDMSPAGHASALHALDLMSVLQGLYAKAAKEAGVDLPRAAFSFASPKGRCPDCKGTGVREISMDVLADLALPCPTCRGRRYRPEVLQVGWAGLHVAQLLETPVDELVERDPQRPLPKALAQGVDALRRVGLGYLALGRPTRALSGGERQRLSLAAALRDRHSPALVALDEPASGLHEADVARLGEVLVELGQRGDLVLFTEHRESLISCADWIVELGPGSGPSGGALKRSEAVREVGVESG